MSGADDDDDDGWGGAQGHQGSMTHFGYYLWAYS